MKLPWRAKSGGLQITLHAPIEVFFTNSLFPFQGFKLVGSIEPTRPLKLFVTAVVYD